MKTFQKIVVIDSCGLTAVVLEQIAQLSEEPINIFNDFPGSDAEIQNRIGDSDCV